MKSLARSPMRKNVGGQPLPTIFPSLSLQNGDFRRSEFSMVAAQPGVGKTFFLLWHCVKWVQLHGLRCLYFSADSSELVMASRAASMVTGQKVIEESEEQIRAGHGPAVDALASLSGLEMSFDPSLTVQVLDLEVKAFIEKWGSPPDAIVLDNLSDVESASGADEWAGLREVGRMSTTMARKLGPAVIALHHVSEDVKYDLGKAPPRKAVMGKVNAKQPLIVTLGDLYQGSIPAAIVKNRLGNSHKDGRTVHMIKADLSRAQFQDPVL